MKKILGIIVLVGLLVLIGFGFTYKMVEPDGWDRVVETVVEKVPVLENIITEKTPAPQPTPATPTPEVNGVPDLWENNNNESGAATAKPSATPAPTATATPSATSSPSPTPIAPEDVDFENMDYVTYNNLSAETQKEFIDTFDSVDDFIVWFNSEKEKYTEDDSNKIIIDSDGVIDLEKYIDDNQE